MSKKNVYERAISVIKSECWTCPYNRCIRYPTVYCLYVLVESTSKCRFDYNVNDAKRVYEDMKDECEYWDLITKNIMIDEGY